MHYLRLSVLFSANLRGFKRANLRGFTLVGLLALGTRSALAQGGQPPRQPARPPATQPAPVAGQGTQGTPGTPGTPGTQGRPQRRTLDIRAQAPAPEVVTIRPREIPVFSRALIAPAMYPAPPARDPNENRGTIVILPGTLPIVQPARPPAARSPENPD